MGLFDYTPEMTDILRLSGDANKEKSLAALAEIAKALETPLRKGVMSGDILDGIFEVVQLAPGATSEFPLDFLAPGTEKDFVAYTIPNHGRIPERHVEGDYVLVPTYDVGASIDWLLKYAREMEACFPGQKRLAEDIGASERSIRTWLKELEKAGLVDIKQRGQGRPNLYTVHIKASFWTRSRRRI